MPFHVVVLMFSIILLLVIAGVLVKYKRWYWLISGYNLMSKEKKKNVDIEGLSRLTGNFCFILAGVLFTGTILNYFGMFIGFALSLGSIFFIVSDMLIKAQKYDNNSKRPDGKLKFSVIAIIGFLMIVFAVAAGSIIYGGMESKVAIGDGYISIDGFYGTKLDLNEVSDISLMDSIPEVERKLNGYDFGNILKGNFELDRIGAAKLYINKGASPYILMKYGSGFVIINFKYGKKTQDLYNEIKSRLKK